jgi:signal peptidase I
MLPTLKVGDYLFVSKTAYGYSQYSFPFGIAAFDGRLFKDLPERGDVVVFRLPSKPSIDYIKRVVALPGETVRVADGRLYINGEKIRRIPQGYVAYGKGASKTRFMKYVEVLPGGVRHHIYEESDDRELDDTKQFRVPEDHVFVMGDNRDHSRDSRVMEQVGFVPVQNLVGRADIVFFSVGRGAHFYEVWKWPWAIRYDRLLHGIGPLEDEKTNSAAMAAPARG